MKNKKGQAGAFILLVVAIVAGLAIFGIASGFLSGDGSPLSLAGEEVQVSSASCPDNGQTTLTFTVQNGENDTAVESFDSTIRIIASDGEVAQGTDTTSGSYTLNCGEQYTIKGTSTSGASGDGAEYFKKVSGPGSIESGNLIFQATKSTHNVIVDGAQHGVLEFRAIDLDNAGDFMCNSDDSCSDYETDGVTFESTTNATALAVGSGGEVHIELTYRPTVVDNIWGDIGGYLILAEAPSGTWEQPTVKVNGKTYSNVKGTGVLSDDETTAYSDYEYIYLIDEVVSRNDAHTLDYSIFAKSGVDPTTDLELDFASRGAFTSNTNDNEVLVGAVQDDASQTQVHNLDDVTIDIS